MREIKFRGLSIVSKTWFYGYYYVEKGRHIIVEGGNHIVCDAKTISEYVGLKSKNSKKIFEGDLVADSRFPEDTFEIVWANGGFWLDKNIGIRGINTEQDLVVVGNIYENPEKIK